MVRQNIDNLGGNMIQMNGGSHDNNNGKMFDRSSAEMKQSNRNRRNEEFVEDLEDFAPGVIPTISNQVSNHVALTNGNIKNGGIPKHALPRAGNGHVANGRVNLRSMLEDAELDSHI